MYITHPTQLIAYYQHLTSILYHSQIIQYARQACAYTGPGSPRNEQNLLWTLPCNYCITIT